MTLITRQNYWEADNVRIRAFEESDIEMYIKNRNFPDSEMQLYYDYIREPLNNRDIRRELEEEISKPGVKYFVIETLDGEYVGEIRILFTEEQYRLFKYGIFISKQQRRKGYAKQALVIALDYYFNELNYQKAISNVYDFNTGSRRFHENFGFKQEGVLRREIYTRGMYRDMIYYGLLREEFNAIFKHYGIID